MDTIMMGRKQESLELLIQPVIAMAGQTIIDVYHYVL